MSNTALPRVGDAQNQRMIGLVEDAITALEASPMVRAVILPAQLIGTTDTRVYTGLGRQARYFWVVDSSADVRVFRGAVPETIDAANYISLRASSAQTVALAVI